MDIHEFYWDYFTNTGNIEAYLAYKENAYADLYRGQFKVQGEGRKERGGAAPKI